MRKTIAAIVVTGVYLLTNLLSGEAAGPVETYQGWSDELMYRGSYKDIRL